MERFGALWMANWIFFNKPALKQATSESQLLKLRQELDELEADHTIEEAADVLVCFIGFCVKKGWSYTDVLDALAAKTAKNGRRQWALQPDGTYQHIKEGS